ncbi:hypothetical protein Q4519_03405 [Motilimonas sp. 1_MG-2023]|uniref:hypothetical protein n=1 Tax=Motilimonas sp. 1_MG-2023 TaxID=3062672 RepID=UPI0026E195A6|nr:hypothetical protein [Motilimonas sp. 1_MG-2023]MDO6524724.1 hypothetical protein [Motilimonas sp. 1_MG-2023]
MEQLTFLVNQFRAAMEKLNPCDFDGTSLSVSKFPEACCDDSSQLLAAYLSDNGYSNAKLIRGANGGFNEELGSHVWLNLDGVHIDITSDQFNKYGYKNPPIIIAEHNDFLSSFEAQDDGIADYRIHLKKYSSPGLESDFKSCYATVLERLLARG